MTSKNLNIRFCGFGGQGIVLSAVILGTTAVTKAGLNAVQMQSYGSEARGGECQAEVIVSDGQIESPLADVMDMLVAMSQPALDKFLGTLKQGGTLIIDPEFVQKPERDDITIWEVPATRMATDIGVKLAANMVMLGYLQEKTGLFGKDDLLEIITANVPAKFLDANLKAAESGVGLAAEN
ncbi:2-oxoacid:acceptor oxidoreductase family protein [Dethiosulfatarculus sandiegensis]|uniref:2-oxoacid:acceptor oxidoreductase family protein n=1 Tax=Dethiosulfatarculus sandiegensis TaxID=1429043 RepID=UPI0005CA8F00|nr:2-oxoacid:acceptor oxidoreductase family protein [Dethiosulfatarculus sandiegensis]